MMMYLEMGSNYWGKLFENNEEIDQHHFFKKESGPRTSQKLQ
jgi:hypothetical protein